MVNQNRKNRLNSEQYASLKAEIAAPYRGLRQFIYIAFGASGSIGAFVFFFQLLAGRNVESALPSFALQVGIVALMVFLWRWEQRRQQRSQSDKSSNP
jgi:Low psii accumulation1 / Rep27